MASLYADENFPLPVVEMLRNSGHDVLTAQEAGRGSQGIPDPLVLADAISLGRAVLTHNRRDYIKLHKRTVSHCGIVVCTEDKDYPALAKRILQSLAANSPLNNKLVRVNKPSTP